MARSLFSFVMLTVHGLWRQLEGQAGTVTGTSNRENMLSGVQVQTPSGKLWVVVDRGKN